MKIELPAKAFKAMNEKQRLLYSFQVQQVLEENTRLLATSARAEEVSRACIAALEEKLAAREKVLKGSLELLKTSRSAFGSVEHVILPKSAVADYLLALVEAE